MPTLRLILPLFLLLARVIAPPRFLQIVGAAVPLFSPLLVLGSLPFVVALVAAIRHAALHCGQSWLR
jgi:hypothetical protein